MSSNAEWAMRVAPEPSIDIERQGPTRELSSASSAGSSVGTEVADLVHEQTSGNETGAELAGFRSKTPAPDPYEGGVFLPDLVQVGWVRSGKAGGPVPYVPREGDIIMTSTKNLKQTLSYLLIGRVGLPHHVMVVVRKSDGTLATLEVGAGGERTVAIRPVCTRLHKHKQTYKGSVISVRQIRRALTPQESYALTCFAESQVGKPFSSKREFLPLTLPGRPVAPTNNNQPTWFCSELVVQSLRVAKLTVGIGRPKAILPEDLYHDEKYDLSALWTKPLDWTQSTNPTTLRPVFDPGRK